MAKCRHKKLALVTGQIDELIPDQEPFEPDVIEKIEIETQYIPFVGHWCPRCDKLVDITLYE